MRFEFFLIAPNEFFFTSFHEDLPSNRLMVQKSCPRLYFSNSSLRQDTGLLCGITSEKRSNLKNLVKLFLEISGRRVSVFSKMVNLFAARWANLSGENSHMVVPCPVTNLPFNITLANSSHTAFLSVIELTSFSSFTLFLTQLSASHNFAIHPPSFRIFLGASSSLLPGLCCLFDRRSLRRSHMPAPW